MFINSFMHDPFCGLPLAPSEKRERRHLGLSLFRLFLQPENSQG
jgi:hypothetical protein